MKQFNKNFVVATMVGVGFLGVSMIANAQQNMSGYSESDTYYNDAGQSIARDYVVYQFGPETNAKTISNSALIQSIPINQQTMNSGSPKIRQQVMNELNEARINGLMNQGNEK